MVIIYDEGPSGTEDISDVLLEEDVSDNVENGLDVLRVRGAGVMVVDGPCRRALLVQFEEAVSDVVLRLVVIQSAVVFGEAHLRIHHLDLLLEDILLVEEDDERGAPEPLRVHQALKKLQRLLHPIHALVLPEHLVISQSSARKRYIYI